MTMLVLRIYKYLTTYKHCNTFVTFSELTLNPPEGIIAGPINEENFFEWEALITYVGIIYFIGVYKNLQK